MTIKFETTREDHLEASLAEGKRTGPRQNRLRIAGYTIVALGVLLLMIKPETARVGGAGSLILIGLAILIVPVWSAYSKLEQQWKASALTRDTITLHADQQALKFETSVWASELQWAAVGKWIETSHLFLLYSNANQFLLSVPKRAFATPEELSEFRELLEEESQTKSDFRSSGGLEVIVNSHQDDK